MSVQPKRSYTVQEYLDLERSSDMRHEYFNGEIFAMGGASLLAQTCIARGNIVRRLGNQLQDRPCRICSADLRVKVDDTGLYTYPDVLVVCGKPELEQPGDTLLNPQVVIEVLSESTEAYDRGRKFEQYRAVASIKDYLLVAQDKVLVEHYSRQPDGRWIYAVANQVSESLARLLHRMQPSPCRGVRKSRRRRHRGGQQELSFVSYLMIRNLPCPIGSRNRWLRGCDQAWNLASRGIVEGTRLFAKQAIRNDYTNNGLVDTPRYYWEDFKVGDTFPLGERRVDQDEMIAFASAYDPQPFHIDEQAAKQSMYGGLIASGWHTVAIVMRMMCDSYLNQIGEPGLARGGQRALAETGAAGRHHPRAAHGARDAGIAEPAGDGSGEAPLGGVQPGPATW